MVQLRETTLVVMVGLWMACSGASTVPALQPTPAPETRATLAGPLCEFGVCKCRDEAGDPQQTVDPGVKRYEVRVGPTDNPLWVSIGEMIFYKSAERATGCFYVDLRPGRHPVRLRASREEGYGARLSISELGPDKLGWYPSFEFACGSPGICTNDQLDEFKRRLASIKKNVHAPCGSTKIREVVWQTGRMPDSLPPGELQLDFILDIYKFSPVFAPGSPECAKK